LIEERDRAIAPRRDWMTLGAWPVIAFFAAVLLFGFSLRSPSPTGGVASNSMLLALVIAIAAALAVTPGCSVAIYWRNRLGSNAAVAVIAIALSTLPLIGAAQFIAFLPADAFGAASGLTALAIACVGLIFVTALPDESTEGIERRRQLTAVRALLKRRLASAEAIPDALVPYLFAFGLKVDQLAQTIPTPGSGVSTFDQDASPTASTARYGGGGGAFGGAGASGAWASAVGSIASGVASPSSSDGSSSSSSSSSGSSSGGGSAGGW
jgi:hypothetical protein